MMKFYDIEQNSEEWFQLKAGKVSGSKIKDVMAGCKDINTCRTASWGEGAKKYAIKIALERITGEYIGDGYSNGHMDRGHEDEPIARELYEELNFCTVTNGGFFDNGTSGCSPDGLVGEKGRIEIKSELPHLFYMTKKQNRAPLDKRWQIPFNLKESNGDWIDCIDYCRQYPEGKRIFVKRFTVAECKTDFQMIDIRLALFEKYVSEIIKTIKA